MIEKRDNVRRSYPMQANATGWGQVIEKEYLADDLAMTFDFFNHEFWDRMDESQKIRMIYSPLYSAESKVLMQTKIKAYDDGITEACDEILEKQGYSSDRFKGLSTQDLEFDRYILEKTKCKKE